MSGVRTPEAHLVPTYTFRRRERADRAKSGRSEEEVGRPRRKRRVPAGMDGAAYRTRTDDLMLTRQLLYQLS